MILDTLEVHSKLMNLPVYNGTTFFFSSFFTNQSFTRILNNQFGSCEERPRDDGLLPEPTKVTELNENARKWVTISPNLAFTHMCAYNARHEPNLT